MIDNSGYLDAYNKGFEDANQDKAKNFKPPFVKALVKGDNYMGEYFKEYNEGYRQALIKKEIRN
jgi:hypothetical protein